MHLTADQKECHHGGFNKRGDDAEHWFRHGKVDPLDADCQNCGAPLSYIVADHAS